MAVRLCKFESCLGHLKVKRGKPLRGAAFLFRISRMKEQVETLFAQYAGRMAERVEELPLSGSSRRYYRLWNGENTCVGVYNENVRENNLFVYFTEHFRRKGLHVPDVLLVAEDRKAYLQRDLGREMLLDVAMREREAGGLLSGRAMALYGKALDELLRFQLEGGEGLDYSGCLPRPVFDERCMRWDLNYFKYCFLRLAGVDADEDRLEDDFDLLVRRLAGVPADSFMFRDFQSRNIMVVDGEVYFIDYQGGRQGALHYDVASLLYDAIVEIPEVQRQELLEHYVGRLARCRGDRAKVFRKVYAHFVLMRLLQALGAFGLRGLHEGKRHFVDSIVPGLRAVAGLLAEEGLRGVYPEIQRAVGLALEKYFVPLRQ